MQGWKPPSSLLTNQVLCMKVAKISRNPHRKLLEHRRTLSTVDASLDNIALDFRSRELTPLHPSMPNDFLRAKDSTGVLLGTAETPSRSSLNLEFLALNLEKVDSYSH
ncbi:hypothetical protein CDAR_544681 [Caerostris darwini]|uniref:Uncharacterized protein n=1 Tax=Caerostris darwini TaxID=1538125 RepID=A0AAV4TRW9_9ARAC|nr:hypothetical protein CDAR_544681 [Caerostris darwini]